LKWWLCLINSFEISLAVIGWCCKEGKRFMQHILLDECSCRNYIRCMQSGNGKQMIKYGNYSTDGWSKQTQRIQVSY
jgi:hypothetical protein